MDSKISLNLIKNWQALCGDIVFTDIAALLIQNKVITVDEYQSIVSQVLSARVESLLLLLLKKNEKILLKFGECLEKDYSWLAELLKEGYTKEESRDETDASPISRLQYNTETENDTLTEDERSANETCKNCHNLRKEKNRHKLNNSVYNKNRNLERMKIIKARTKNRLKPKVDNTEGVSSTTELIKPQKNEEISDEVITIIKRNPSVSKSWTTLAHALGLTDRINDIRCKVFLGGEDLNMCIVYLIKDWKEKFSKMATLSRLIEILHSEDFNATADKLTEVLYRDHKSMSSTLE